MSARSTLDPESFQNILASAFAVQECLVDTQSLSAIVEVRRLMARGTLDVNGAMQVIADRARNVADATGVAIAVLKRDQLVYRAGSGSAKAYTGRHVTAMLSVSAGTKARREILRVENTETDKRIEAAICRQRGAKSLLILPIYHEREMAGVLEVLFGEAHAFQECEVLTYQLMVQVVEDAMSHAAQLEMKKAMPVEVSTPPLRIERNVTQIQKSRNDNRSRPNERGISPTCRTALAPPEKLQPIAAQVTTMTTHRATRFPRRLWKVADLAAVVTVLMMASWIAYSYRHPVTPSALPNSNAIERPLPSVPTKLVPAITSRPQTARPREQVRKTARRMPRRVHFGNNEVDYVTEDVTIRYFTPRPSRQPVSVRDSQVEYVSEDVTVRHFTPKPAVVPK